MRKAVLIGLALVTVILSVAFSQIYYSLALKMIPPMAMSEVNRGAGQVIFAGWGILFGLVAAILEGVVYWIITRRRA